MSSNPSTWYTDLDDVETHIDDMFGADAIITRTGVALEGVSVEIIFG